jgi:hypothetical protein
VFNDAPSFGSIGPEFKTDVEGCVPMRLWTDSSLPVCFNQLKRTSAFAAASARQELMDRLNAIPGVAIPPDAGVGSFGKLLGSQRDHDKAPAARGAGASHRHDRRGRPSGGLRKDRYFP